MYRKRLLRKSEFIHLAPDMPGVRRVNHQADHCSGDSVSMLVERKDNGDISAHCFRCDSGGFHAAQVHYRSAEERAAHRPPNAGDVVVGGISLPADSTGIVEEFSRPAREWLAKAGLPSAVIEQEGFTWSEDEQGLYIPVRQEDDLKGFVKRTFKQDAKSRYKTFAVDNSEMFGYYRASKPSDTIVLVEDVLSALRVRDVSDALALLTTSIRPRAISKIVAGGYKRVLVYLDSDNAIVRMEARRIARKLPFLPVGFIETGRDPKYESRETLARLIGECNEQA